MRLFCLYLLLVLGLVTQSAQAQGGPTIYGKVLLQSSSGQSVQDNVTVELIPLGIDRARYRVYTDPRGIFSFYGVDRGVYRLQLLINDKIGGGTTVNVAGEGIRIPDLIFDPSDPCLAYYGRGYATDYIHTKINTPWRGNSRDWLGLAKGAGWRLSLIHI